MQSRLGESTGQVREPLEVRLVLGVVRRLALIPPEFGLDVPGDTSDGFDIKHRFDPSAEAWNRRGRRMRHKTDIRPILERVGSLNTSQLRVLSITTLAIVCLEAPRFPPSRHSMIGTGCSPPAAIAITTRERNWNKWKETQTLQSKTKPRTCETKERATLLLTE
jgi:hypothetical protein